MGPWKPKSGIVLISTNQNRIFLDLVLGNVQMLPLHVPELGKQRVAGISSLVLTQPHVPPKHSASHTWDESFVHLTAH